MPRSLVSNIIVTNLNNVVRAGRLTSVTASRHVSFRTSMCAYMSASPSWLAANTGSSGWNLGSFKNLGGSGP